jgi:hypothetical protein
VLRQGRPPQVPKWKQEAMYRIDAEGNAQMAQSKVMTWWDPAWKDAVRLVEKACKATRRVIMKGLGTGCGRAEFLLHAFERHGVASRGKRSGHRLLRKRTSS